MTLVEMEKLADFYQLDLYDMIDSQNEGELIIPENPIHGLNPEDLSIEDFEVIVQFGRIVKNYKRMKRIIENDNRNV